MTRPREPRDALARALREAGARVVAAPLLRIAPPSDTRPLDACLRRLRDYDAVVFTSHNAVESVFLRMKALRVTARPRRVYAVGPRTRRTLVSRGWTPRPLAAEHHAAALAKVIDGDRILWPRALKARDALPAALRARGASLAAPVAYRTVADPAGAAVLRKAPRLDAVAFLSPSAAARFLRLPRSVRIRVAGGAVAASIGPATSKALRRRWRGPLVEAAQATPAALVDALARHWRPA